MSRTKIEDKLAVNRYEVDRESHVSLNEDACKSCSTKACQFACPAGCYKLVEEHITFSYEGCLECGSCIIACGKGAITWKLPRAGRGISYQYG